VTAIETCLGNLRAEFNTLSNNLTALQRGDWKSE
jgi:hypothetical protein